MSFGPNAFPKLVEVNEVTIGVELLSDVAYPVSQGCKTLDNRSRVEASKYNHPSSVAKRERERA